MTDDYKAKYEALTALHEVAKATIKRQSEKLDEQERLIQRLKLQLKEQRLNNAIQKPEN